MVVARTQFDASVPTASSASSASCTGSEAALQLRKEGCVARGQRWIGRLRRRRQRRRLLRRQWRRVCESWPRRWRCVLRLRRRKALRCHGGLSLVVMVRLWRWRVVWMMRRLRILWTLRLLLHMLVLVVVLGSVPWVLISDPLLRRHAPLKEDPVAHGFGHLQAALVGELRLEPIEEHATRHGDDSRQAHVELLAARRLHGLKELSQRGEPCALELDGVRRQRLQVGEQLIGEA